MAQGNARHRASGLALILVIFVVVALVLVAVPFVLSMILQERSGHAARYRSQADFGADGARNWAVARRMRGLDFMERRFPSPPFDSYSFDTADEFLVRLEDLPVPGADVLNSRGAIWGTAIQDEQGKINLRSAPPALIERIRGLANSPIVDFKDFTTIYSTRDSRWVFPQRLRGLYPVKTVSDGLKTGVVVDDPIRYGPGARVRISRPGLDPLESTMRVYLVSRKPVAYALAPEDPVPTGYFDGMIEVERRHPVNVNTAPRVVLVAILEGLSIPDPVKGDPDRRWIVSRATAERASDDLRRAPLHSMTDLIKRIYAGRLHCKDRAAILANAIDPTQMILLGTGTMPFIFWSYDTMTVQAECSMNHPAGAQAAGRGFREVVTVSAPSELTFFAESQYDFDRPLRWAADLPEKTLPPACSHPPLCAFSLVLAEGFPFGNRMLTFPTMMPKESDRRLLPQQPANERAWLQLKPADTRWGEGGYQHTYEPYADTQEGRDFRGSSQAWKWKEVFTSMPHPEPEDPVMRHPDIAAGGAAFWVRFRNVSDPLPLLDVREREFENRLGLRVEGGMLILTATDASLGSDAEVIDKGLAEVRQPFAPRPDTWYHVSAYWKGTHYGELAVLVDGFSHPEARFGHVDESGRKIQTRLAKDLDPGDAEIRLEDDSFLPEYPTPIVVGSEVILYDRKNRAHVRGARGSIPADHPAQAAATIFGYSSKLRKGMVTVDLETTTVDLPYDRLTKGGARVSMDFGANPRAFIPSAITDNDTTLIVDSPDLTEFPEQGYIRIENEIIFYESRTDKAFKGCSRGEHGTPAEAHPELVGVMLWCIPVDSQDEYLSPTILQIGDEWFGPVQRDPIRPGFWISFVDGGVPAFLHRGPEVMGSERKRHFKGDEVIPTFLIRDSRPKSLAANAGALDLVTILDAENNKEQQRIRRAEIASGRFSCDVEAAQVAAFHANVSRVYQADDLHVRVLKFPSGELLGYRWLELANPKMALGPVSGTVDEVNFFALPKTDLRLHRALTAPPGEISSGESEEEVWLSSAPGRAPALEGDAAAVTGGAVKTGDEIIGYGDVKSEESEDDEAALLRPSKREFLRSRRQVHDKGDPVMILPLRVSRLAGSVGPRDPLIPTNLSEYLLINGEILLISPVTEVVGEEARALSMPRALHGAHGLFRGRFGTAPQPHAEDDLAYAIPFRFYDTYSPREFDSRMAYFQWSARADLARWKRVTWRQAVPHGDPRVVVRALARVDGKGEFWDAPVATADVLLYQNGGGRNAIQIDRTGYQHEAGQFDLRFTVEYRPGAFLPATPWGSDAWKHTPRLWDLRIEYDRPTIIHFHEDR